MAQLQRVYQADVAAGVLSPDAAQQALLAALDTRLMALQSGERPRGLYIHGPPGRGKSMLLEWFLAAVPTPAKRRVHFHDFMQELHGRLHALGPTHGQDPMALIAADIAAGAQVLCFDEFYVTNIADGMLLGRLFQFLVQADVLLLLTSNWPPAELFQGGVNRQQFLPFVRNLLAAVDVLDLGPGTDYRFTHTGDWPRWHVGFGRAAYTWLQSQPGAAHAPIYYFSDICFEPLAREDYLAILQQRPYPQAALYVYDIPQLNPEEADAALRFIMLVDFAYELRIPLVCTAHTVAGDLCRTGAAAHPYQRCYSRLAQMQSWPVATGNFA